MEDGLDAAKLLNKFEHTIYTQLRTLGVVLHDDAGNMMKPGGGEEARVVRNIARNCAQIILLQEDCQTSGAPSYATMTPEEQWEHDKARGRLDDES